MKTLAGAMLVAVLLGARAASAAESDTLTLYASGNFRQAEAAGLAEGNAAGLALAARAVLADEMMHSPPCFACLKRAEDYSRRAIAADPKLAEGHIYLTVSLGLESRIIGPVEARLKGYGEEAKTNIDQALDEEPDNPWALAALGGWNIEIVRNGGTTLGSWLYGASVEAGKKAFFKAFAADRRNLVLRYQYALALATYDLDGNRREVQESLAIAVAGTPFSAYDKFAQGRARELLDALKTGDEDNIGRLVLRDDGYP
jgi:hypothetical protein